MALKVLNACCVLKYRLPESAMPNYGLLSVAKGFRAMGIDLGGQGGGFGSAMSKCDIGSAANSDANTLYGTGLEMLLPAAAAIDVRSSLPKHSRTCAQLSQWIYDPFTAPPANLSRIFLHEATESETVQWALLSPKQDQLLSSTDAAEPDTVFVVFKGTSNSRDMITDANVQPYDGLDHQLRVHGGMITSLGQGKHERKDVLSVLTRELQKVKCKFPCCDTVICGHSLGGGYALLIALDLLQQQQHTPSAVITFGAPQVVIPPASEATPAARVWQQLNCVGFNFVHSYDPVPRLAGEHCNAWLEVMLEAAKNKQLSHTGSVYIDPKLVKGTAFLSANMGLAMQYRTVGKVCFFTAPEGGKPGLLITDSGIDQSIAAFGKVPSRAGCKFSSLLAFHKLSLPEGAASSKITGGYIGDLKKLFAETGEPTQPAGAAVNGLPISSRGTVSLGSAELARQAMS
jgi:hypothetical protein